VILPCNGSRDVHSIRCQSTCQECLLADVVADERSQASSCDLFRGFQFLASPRFAYREMAERVIVFASALWCLPDIHPLFLSQSCWCGEVNMGAYSLRPRTHGRMRFVPHDAQPNVASVLTLIFALPHLQPRRHFAFASKCQKSFSPLISSSFSAPDEDFFIRTTGQPCCSTATAPRKTRKQSRAD
jgi:hypothetical protein